MADALPVPRHDDLERLVERVHTAGLGHGMHALMRRLFPIGRSLTGNGVRATLRMLSELVPLELREFPTGTTCFDWTIPNEWNIRDAYVSDPSGRRVIDWRANNLHVIGYSTPVSARMTLEELRPYLHTLPDLPDAIPYLTSYYSERWGFCLSHRQLEAMTSSEYDVRIDATLAPGHLTMGEAVLPGTTPDEILFSTDVCHPSLANNELSGPVLMAHLYQLLASLAQRRYTYRFVFIPETIGALAFLSIRGEHLSRSLRAGYVVTCVGDPGPFTFKLSRRGRTLADRAGLHVLAHYARPEQVRIHEFFPTGSDERQYCSPGFDLPVASLMRSMYGTYPEYHTSLDDLSFVTPEALAGSLAMYLRIVQALELNATYRNVSPYGEPQLGRRGLYRTLGAQKGTSSIDTAMMWVLALADGKHDLIAMADRAKVPVATMAASAEQLLDVGLLAPL